MEWKEKIIEKANFYRLNENLKDLDRQWKKYVEVEKNV